MCTAPQRRYRVFEEYGAPFPLLGSQEISPLRDTVYQGELINNTVLIRQPSHILDIYGKGYFGKGVLSRARPKHGTPDQFSRGHSIPVKAQSKYEQQVSLVQGLGDELSSPKLSQTADVEGEREDTAGPGKNLHEKWSDAESCVGSRRTELDSAFSQEKRLWLGSETDSHPVDIRAKIPNCRLRCTEETLSLPTSGPEQWANADGREQEGNRRAKANPSGVTEYLQLTLEEAFFLVYALGCLSVYSGQEPQSVVPLWRRFQSIQSNFPWSYTAYHFYRSKGWVPKPGLKYGADLMLYRKGPPFYHASYSVVVQAVGCGSALGTLRSFSWRSLAALNRVTANVSKELLLCYVIRPDDFLDSDLDSPLCLNKLTVQEVIMSRWISSQEQEQDDI